MRRKEVQQIFAETELPAKVEITFPDGFDMDVLMAMVVKLAKDGYHVNVRISEAFPKHKATLLAYWY